MFGVDDMNIPLACQTLGNWRKSALQGPVPALQIFSFLAIITQFQDSSSLLNFLEDFPEAHVTALFEALRRTLLVAWWDRIWVVQEAVVARDITIRYSDVAASWEFLVEVTRTLSRWDFAFTRYPSSISADCLKVFNLFSRISDLDHHRNDWTAMQRTDLLSLLRFFGHRKASDNRDRVYALLGLCSDGVAIRPNYLLNEAEVYTEAALAIIKNTRSLSIMYGDHSRKTSQDLPSYIPDWSTIPDESDRQRARIFNLYNACGGVIPIIETPKLCKFLQTFSEADDPNHYLHKEAAFELQTAYEMSFAEPEIQSICASLVEYCNGMNRKHLRKYSLIRNSGRSLVAACMKIGTVTGIMEPLYTCSDIDTAAKVILGWAQAANKSIKCASGDFLTTIMSGMKKNPDGSLERLRASDIPALETWYHKKIERIALGKDQQQLSEPLETNHDAFADVLRLSATKRTLFIMNQDRRRLPLGNSLSSTICPVDDDSSMRAEALIRDCRHVLEALRKMLTEDAGSLGGELVNKGVELVVKNDKLFPFLESIIQRTYFISSEAYRQFLSRCANLINKRKSILPQNIEFGFNLGIVNLRRHTEYLKAYEDLIIGLRASVLFTEAHRKLSSQHGYLGLGPLLMKEGDEIYVLPGSRSPLVLRPTSMAYPRTYQLVGDYFINGAMDGDSSAVGSSIDCIRFYQPKSKKRRHYFSIQPERLYEPARVGEIVTLEIVWNGSLMNDNIPSHEWLHVLRVKHLWPHSSIRGRSRRFAAVSSRNFYYKQMIENIYHYRGLHTLLQAEFPCHTIKSLSIQ
jgi:hypothetical protein